MFATKLVLTKAGKLLTLGLLLHGLSYALPFLGERIGLEFFGRGMKQLLKGNLEQRFWGIFAVFFIPVWTLPIFVVRWFVNKPLGAFWRGGIVLCLLCPHIGNIVAVVVRHLQIGRGSGKDFIGYGVWLLSYLLIVLALFYKRKTLKEEREPLDHLIE
jgi:hypothetical protein